MRDISRQETCSFDKRAARPSVRAYICVCLCVSLAGLFISRVELAFTCAIAIRSAGRPPRVLTLLLNSTVLYFCSNDFSLIRNLQTDQSGLSLDSWRDKSIFVRAINFLLLFPGVFSLVTLYIFAKCKISFFFFRLSTRFPFTRQYIILVFLIYIYSHRKRTASSRTTRTRLPCRNFLLRSNQSSLLLRGIKIPLGN